MGVWLLALLMLAVSTAHAGDIYGPDAPQHPCWVDASCDSVSLAKQIPGWETVYRLGLTGDGIVVVTVGRGVCGYANGGKDGFDLADGEAGQFKLWVNDGEVPNNGVDDDTNGCIDDYHGCYTTTTASYIPPVGDPYDPLCTQGDSPFCGCPTVPRGDQANVPWLFIEKFDFSESVQLTKMIGVNDSTGSATRNGEFGLYPDARSTSVTVTQCNQQGCPDADEVTAQVLQVWIDNNTDQKFVVLLKSGGNQRGPATQADCDSHRSRFPLADSNISHLEALTGNVFRVNGFVGGDWIWPSCESDTKWFAMGLIGETTHAPSQQGANPPYDEYAIPAGYGGDPNTIRSNGYYNRAWHIQTETPVDPNALIDDPNFFPLLDFAGNRLPGGDYYGTKRLVGIGVGYYGLFSYQWYASMTYVIPMLEVAQSAMPTENDIRDILVACAPRAGKQGEKGPENLSGYDRDWGYGMPDLACAVLGTSRQFGGDLDGDGVSDDVSVDDPVDNCPFVKNPGQQDADTDDIGDACDPDTAVLAKPGGSSFAGGGSM